MHLGKVCEQSVSAEVNEESPNKRGRVPSVGESGAPSLARFWLARHTNTNPGRRVFFSLIPGRCFHALEAPAASAGYGI